MCCCSKQRVETISEIVFATRVARSLSLSLSFCMCLCSCLCLAVSMRFTLNRFAFFSSQAYWYGAVKNMESVQKSFN